MTGIFHFFKPILGLPCPSETEIGEQATAGANSAVQKVMEQQGTAGKRKRKAYMAFTDKQRAKIGPFVAENGNAAALKKFRSDTPDLGESTVCPFKRKYVDALKNAPWTRR